MAITYWINNKAVITSRSKPVEYVPSQYVAITTLLQLTGQLVLQLLPLWSISKK